MADRRRIVDRLPGQEAQEQPQVAPRDLAAALRRSAKATAAWKALAPGYRRLYVRWITDAKQAATRARRIAIIVAKIPTGQKRF